MLQIVYQGLKDPSAIVRNSALFAIGQFSEHLQVRNEYVHCTLLVHFICCDGEKQKQNFYYQPIFNIILCEI